MNQEDQGYKTHESDDTALSIRDMLDKYIVHWRWLLVSVVICLVIGWLYARYQTPSYESVASVLIEQENPGMASEEIGMLKDLGLASGGGVLEDEIELYKSRSLMERVVRDLRLNWKYQNLGTKTGLVRSELYDSNPIRIRCVDADSLFYDKHYEFDVTLNSKYNYTVTEGKGLKGSKFGYGVIVRSPVGKFVLEKSPEFENFWVGKSIRITLAPVSQVANGIQQSLSIEPASKEANILVLKVKGHNVEKNNALLNRIIAVHQENAINSKNEVVKNTTEFINDRMKFIAAELTDVEKEGESYKSQHHLIDVTTDAAAYLGKEGDIERKVVETSIEMNLAEFMNEVISQQNGYEQLLPANLGFKDPSIGQMTTQYNALVLERNRLRETSGNKHPGVARIESQLASLRTSLEGSLRNMQSSSQLQLKKLKNEEQIYQSKISSIPLFEREYRDILRQQQIKESLYLFLLQKREQNEISLAATVANTRVIDAAYSNGVPVAPHKKLIYLIGILVGLFIPVLVIYLRDLLNNKINTRADLDNSSLTVVGDIPHAKNTEDLVILSNPQSSVAEAFRVLRSNLSFMTSSVNGANVINVTSTVSGEGKSTTSVNLAFIYSTVGKKVLLIGADLRKPRIKEILNMNTNLGLSNFLANKELKKEDIIFTSTLFDHSVDVIQSGSIPPNPSELLMNSRFDELMNELKQEYDFIIIDNAPVGLVIDAVTTNRFVDVTLYVIRSGMVDKRVISRISELVNNKKLTNLCVLLNDVKSNNQGYSYTYGYGNEANTAPWWKRLLGVS